MAAGSATSELRYCISLKLMDRQTEHGNKLFASAKMIDKCQWLRMCGRGCDRRGGSGEKGDRRVGVQQFMLKIA